MEIKIRNLDPSIIKSIDEKAKKSKQSRQEFMKEMIENYVMINEFNDREYELKTSLDKSTEVIASMKETLKKNNEILLLLMEEEEE